jgi:membrane protein required for colicin V production
MNLMDVFLCVPLAWAAYRGFTKGFIMGISTLAALLLGIYGAMYFSVLLSDYLINNHDFSTSYIGVFSFVVVFIVVVVFITIVAKLLERFVQAIALSTVNKLVGVGFYLLKYAFIISVLLSVVKALDIEDVLLSEEKKSSSLLYEPIAKLAPLVFPKLKALKEELPAFYKEKPEKNLPKEV